jgi:lipopolysaccharide export system protein LptA
VLFGGFIVKRIVLCALLALSAAALASAQGRDWRGRSFPGVQPAPAEQVTVTGNLTITQGALAVKSGDITYFVPGLLRYAGFIDSLKDGAQVRLEGASVAVSQDAKTKKLWVSKLTVGGKDYDLARPQPDQPAAPFPPMMRQRFQHRW